jgi:hypothetical protein
MFAGLLLMRYAWIMMKYLRILFLLAVAPISIWSAENTRAMIDNEINRMDALIKATENTLELEQRVRNNIVEYQRIQELFLLAPEDNEMLMKMVRIAHKTLLSIQEAHLEYTFDPDFINELKFLSSVAVKRGIPKP